LIWNHRAVQPHLGLAGNRRRQQGRRVDGEFGRDVLPLQRRRRRGRLDVEFQRMLAGAGIAGDPDAAVTRHHGVGVEALDLVLDAVAQVGEHDRAAGNEDMLDRERGRDGTARRLGRDVARALALQRQVQYRADDNELADFGLAGPDAGQGDVGLDAGGGQAVGDVAVLGVGQRDILQGHVERRPDADLGRAVDGQLVAGVALDALLDRRRQEGGGDADHQQQRDHDDHGSKGGACDFQCSHLTFQTGKRA